jgi:hypothetical protein
MDLQKVRCGGMDWIDAAFERYGWRDLVNAVMNFGVQQNVVNFLTSRGSVSFSRGVLFHGKCYLLIMVLTYLLYGAQAFLRS